MIDYSQTPHFKHNIYLIRHGETPWSKNKKHTGLTNLDLTPKGIEEAKALKNALKNLQFKKVFVSPLKRAKQTCECAGLLNVAEEASDLLEWNYGEFEGKTTSEIREKIPNWNIFDHGPSEGETISQVALRADHILSLSQKIDGDVAFFSSGHISRIIGARWINLDPILAKGLALSTASISVLSYEHEWRVVKTWNDVSHLK